MSERLKLICAVLALVIGLKHVPMIRIILHATFVAIFMFGAIFGVAHFGMGMGDEGQVGCPFMGITALCDMSFFEHISAWQNMFASHAQQSLTLQLLLLFGLVFGSVIIGRIPIAPPRRVVRTSASTVTSSNPLQELFASGILNPKVF